MVILQQFAVSVEELKARVNLDVSDLPIRDLCCRVHADNGSEEMCVTYFKFNNDVKQMLRMLSRAQGSSVFLEFWESCGKKAQAICTAESTSSGLSIEQVEELVWKPALQRCSHVIERLLEGDISLQEVDAMFQKFQNRFQELEQELLIMIEFCKGGNLDLLNQRIKQIAQYQKLQQCVQAARMIWDFKDAMNLVGGFEKIDEFRSQV